MRSTVTFKLKRTTIACNLVCNIAAKRVEKGAAFHLGKKTRNSVGAKVEELRHLLQNKFALADIKRTTCTDFVTKSSTSLYFLQQLSITFQDKFDAWVVKRATSLLNSFCSNIAKQVTCFFCSFYRTFRGGFISKYSHHCQATSRKLTRLPSSLHYRGWC